MTETTDDPTIDPDPTDDPTDSTGDPTPPDPPPEPCDVRLQDCPLGQKCAPDVTGVEDHGWCVSVVGDGMAGEPCTLEGDTRVDDCDGDSFCHGGECRAFCAWDNDWPTCEWGDSCWQVGSLCMPECMPLFVECQPGEGCYVNPDYSWSCLPNPGSLGQGESCEQQFACQSNYVCLEAEAVPGCASASCCTTTCDIEDLDSCGANSGMTCFLLEPDPWCESQVGVCAALDWSGGC